jgi:hypothetical protein
MALYLCTGPQEQKAVNRRANPHCVLTTGTNRWKSGLDVVVEGGAIRVTEAKLLGDLAERWLAKYGGDWRFDVRDGVFYQDAGIAHVFEVRPSRDSCLRRVRVAQTRFRFDEAGRHQSA